MAIKRALIVHRLTKIKPLAAALETGNGALKRQEIQAAKRDSHRMYDGWYRGLKRSGWQVKLIDTPTYLAPEWLLQVKPFRYIRLLQLVNHPQSSAARFVKWLDATLFNLHILPLLCFFRPRFALFPYEGLGWLLNRVCKWLRIRTISYFGTPPVLKSDIVKEQVLEYDHVISGYDLPALWPEVKARFARVILGPSEESDYIPRLEHSQSEDIAVCVIGGFGGDLFRTRAAISEALLPRLSEMGIEAHLYGYEMAPLDAEYPALKRALRGPLYGEPFYTTIKRSKIYVNIPNDDQIAIGSARPQGIMEVAASRTFQLAYDTEEAKALFVPDSEIVVFKSLEDLVAKIGYYLEHEEERERIAGNAFERFLREYTGERQIIRLLEQLGLLNG